MCGVFKNGKTCSWIPIARRRHFKPQDKKRSLPRINDQIRATQVRLIDQNGNMQGVVEFVDANRQAREAGFDLVEVSPNSDPPVCRILDFGKYRYEQSKKDRANRAKSKTFETKEVRLGRSMKIDPHDVEIRLNQARKFLLEGHKVMIVQNFRGREMMHREKGDERMKEIIKRFDDIAKVEMTPRFAGRRQTMVLAPDKAKIKILESKLINEKFKASEEISDSQPNE